MNPPTKKTPAPRRALVAEKPLPTAASVRAEKADRKAERESERSAKNDHSRLAKPQRQHRITRLLEQHAVSSQAQLVDLLADDGVVATQATVSRDLEDMGAVKVRVPGGELVYAIPELPSDQIAPEDHLRRVFGDWVVDVAVSHHIVVLRTPPGSAHVVASALDRAGLEEIVGTIAGDDTVMVVCAEHQPGWKMAERMRVLAGL
jgi:transcriptional regulator of arginine metabolism